MISSARICPHFTTILTNSIVRSEEEDFRGTGNDTEPDFQFAHRKNSSSAALFLSVGI
jgi:hypothetical protein